MASFLGGIWAEEMEFLSSRELQRWGSRVEQLLSLESYCPTPCDWLNLDLLSEIFTLALWSIFFPRGTDFRMRNRDQWEDKARLTGNSIRAHVFLIVRMPAAFQQNQPSPWELGLLGYLSKPTPASLSSSAWLSSSICGTKSVSPGVKWFSGQECRKTTLLHILWNLMKFRCGGILDSVVSK